MLNVILTVYILIWPVLVAITLLVMCIGVYRDARTARAEGEPMV